MANVTVAQLSNSLLEKTKAAVESGILLPEHFSDAITASDNDPAVVRFLESQTPEYNKPAVQDTYEISEQTVDREARRGAYGKAHRKEQERREAVEAADPEYILTLSDIEQNENLRRLGAVSGDKVSEDGELVRIWSDDEDDIDLGYRLTQEDVHEHANLIALGASEGDRIVDGELVSSEYDDEWTQFKYRWDKSTGVIRDAGIWLEAHAPIGVFSIDLDDNEFSAFDWSHGDELYGEGFTDASYDKRREMIVARKERQLAHDYGHYFERDMDSKAGFAGEIAGAMADPTSLIPFGVGWKAAATTGAVLGGSATAAHQWSTTGEVDPKAVAIGATLGAILPPAVNKGASIVATKSANKLVIKAQAVVDDHMRMGGNLDSITTTLQKAGINPAAVQAAGKRVGKKVRIPANQTRAERAIQQAISKDSATSRLYSKAMDKYLGVISTRLGNISEIIKYGMRKFEFNSHVNTAKYSKMSKSFFIGLRALPKHINTQVGKHLYNGEMKAAEGLMRAESPELADTFTNTIRPMLDELGTGLKNAGHSFEKIEDYFPRLLKDYDKLRATLGAKEQGVLTRQLEAFAKKKGVAVANLTNDERSQVLDLALRGFNQKVDGGKLRFAKERKITTVTDDMMEHYAKPEESLAMYIRTSVNDIEKRKFFGRTGNKYKGDATRMDDAGQFDNDASIGKLVDDAIAKGEVSPAREQELKELLSARFIGGEQSPSATASTIRDLGYLGTIANPLTAVLQFADISISAAKMGLRHTIAAMFGTKNLKIVDLGIDDLIMKELAMGSPRMTSRLLGKTMGVVGFKAIDRLGKETYINAAFKKYTSMVKNPKGEAKIRRDVQEIFGDETDAFVADLKAGNISENVKLWAFNQLSDVQPISLMEMPEAYLNAKNGRLAYMLKSFTIKQIDIVRRDIIQQWGKGNKVEAVKNAAVLGTYLTISNTGIGVVRDLMKGREVKAEDIPDKALWALLGVYGMNEYIFDKYLSQGKIVEGMALYITPATPIVDAVITLGMELPKDDPNVATTLRALPAAGELMYQWFGGGAERYNERMRKKRADK